MATQEYETELVLTQEYFIYAQPNPEAHSKSTEGSPCVKQTSQSTKCTEESGEKKKTLRLHPRCREALLSGTGCSGTEGEVAC